MDWDGYRLGFEIFQFAFTCGVGLYAWQATRHKAAEASVSELAQRIARAETRLEDTPTSKALHEVAICLERQSGELHVVGERLAGLNEIVRRLERITDRQEEYLLKESKR